MPPIISSLALLLLCAGVTAGTAAAQEAPIWTIEDTSRVGFVAYQGGAEVEGAFERFEADIRFDPDALGASRVVIEIDIASVDSASAERDSAIRSKDFFDVATWPTARFEAANFEAQGDGSYIAYGRLTMRGVTRDVVLPLSLAIGDHPDRPGHHRAIVDGEMAVLRLDYGIGQGAWRDTSLVANEVVIRIHVVAARPAGG